MCVCSSDTVTTLSAVRAQQTSRRATQVTQQPQLRQLYYTANERELPSQNMGWKYGWPFIDLRLAIHYKDIDAY